MEDFPEVAMFLISLDPQQAQSLSVHGQDVVEPIDSMANDMLAQAQAIMSAAEADGSDPDERLRAIVSQAVQNGLLGASNPEADDASVKRPRNE
jgi:DNA invertase Pin-like site-specific DNA recombinase